jgi:zinc protease
MLDRKTPPPFVRSTSFDLLQPDERRLESGIPVYLIRGGDQDVIKIELVFRAGRWYESTPGASHFSSTLLTKGTWKKSSFDIAQIFDQYGAHVEIHPGLDFVSISIYALNRHLAPVIALFMELMNESSFPEKEIEQSKSIFIQNLKVSEEKTSYLASKAFRKHLFGTNHPYGREIEQKDVEALQQHQIINHFESVFNNPLVFISGKITDATERLCLEAFRQFKSIEKEAAPHYKSVTANFQKHLAKEGSVQASIRLGKKSLLRSNADYPEAVFISHILGGYFGSRLMKNIREEKGLTYGIYASLQPLQNESYLTIGADVNKDKVELTIAEIKKEIRTLRSEPIHEDELVTAKNHFIGSLQSEITTPFAHADKLKTIILSSLPGHYYQNLISKIDHISADRIMELTDRYFHEDSMNYIAVG